MAPGTFPADPDRYDPTGTRTFARVYPTEDQQAAAVALFTQRLGAEKVYVLQDAADTYSRVLTHAFVSAAGKLGFDTVVPRRPSVAGLDRFLDQLEQQGVDAAFLPVVPGSHGVTEPVFDRMAYALRERFGPEFPIIGPDSFLAPEPGITPEGMYVSGASLSDPARQLPPGGQQFVADFSATQPDGVVNTFTPYAAQATEVLLAAVAASHGTRESVVDELLAVQVEDGILGSFAFDVNGDITVNSMPVFQVPELARQRGDWPLVAVIDVPSGLPAY